MGLHRGMFEKLPHSHKRDVCSKVIYDMNTSVRKMQLAQVEITFVLSGRQRQAQMSACCQTAFNHGDHSKMRDSARVHKTPNSPGAKQHCSQPNSSKQINIISINIPTDTNVVTIVGPYCDPWTTLMIACLFPLQ